MSAATALEPVSFRTDYCDVAVNDLPGILERAAAHLDGVEFDTLVGRGFSGSMVIPALAQHLGKSFILVRKENDGSHHSRAHGAGPLSLLVGNVGERWLFVDDFVSSGETRLKALEALRAGCAIRGRRTVYVGDYCYARYANVDPGPYGVFNPGAECPKCQSISVTLTDDLTAVANCWDCEYIPGGVQ